MEGGTWRTSKETIAKFLVDRKTVSTSSVSVCVISTKHHRAIENRAETPKSTRCYPNTWFMPNKWYKVFSRTALQTVDCWSDCNHESSKIHESKYLCTRYASNFNLLKNCRPRFLKGNIYFYDSDCMLNAYTFVWFQVVPLTTGYLASAGTLYTKETQGNKVVTLCAGALPDSADPVRF